MEPGTHLGPALEGGIGHVVVAVDLTPGSLAAVQRAATLPLARGAGLTLLHVLPPRGARREVEVRQVLRGLAEEADRLRDALGRPPVEIYPAVLRGSPAHAVLEQARADRAELVVIGRHAGGLLRELVGATTAARVIRGGAPAVLAVKAPFEGPYRRVLLALDLEATWRSALQLTLRMVGPHAGVRVVHAWEPPGFYTEAFPPLEAAGLRWEAAREAREAARAALGDLGRDWRLVVREGRPAIVVADEAAQSGAELVVLGTAARRGLGRALFGSVATSVLRRAPCDVLIARPGA